MANNHQRPSSRAYVRVLSAASALVVATGVWQTYQLGNKAELHQREMLLANATAIARTIPVERVKQLSFTAADRETPVYQQLSAQLSAAGEHLGLRSIYTIARRGGGYVFGPESVSRDEPVAAPPGTPYQQAPREVADVFKCHVPKSTDVYTDEYGTFVSTFVPVLEPSTGEALLVVGIDVSAATWQRRIAQARQVPLFLTLTLLSILMLSHFVLGKRRRLQPRRPWRIHCAEAVLCALVMLTLTAAATWHIHASERQTRLATFSSLAYAQASGIARELWDLREKIDGTRRFFQASDWVDQNKFHLFSERLTQDGATQACLWLPAVPARELAPFEEAARRQGLADFKVWQFSGQGERVPASGRETCYPALFIEARAGLQRGLEGYDLSSEPVRRQAIEKAVRNGLPSATETVTLFALTNTPAGIVIFQPVASARQQGLTALAVRMDDLIKTPLYRAGSLTRGLVAELFQLDGGRPALILASSDPHGHPSSADCWPAGGSSLKIRVPVFCFGKVYAVVIHTTPAWLARHPLREGWTAAMAGLLVTVLLTAFIALLSNRRTALEREVQSRITALRQAEQLYQTLFQEMHYGFILCEVVRDAQGQPDDYRFLSVNPAFERITGFEAAPLIGKTVSEVPFYTNPVWPQIYRQVAITGDPENFTSFIQEANRFIEGTIFRPSPNQIACIFADVTSRKRAEDKVQAAAEETRRLLAEADQARIVLLRAAEEQARTDEALVHERNLLYALMDNLPDCIYFKDTRSRFIKISKAQAVSLGLADPADAIGKSDTDFQPGEIAEHALATERQIIETGQPLLAQVEQTQTADGKVKWVSASKAPIRDQDGRVIGLVGISRDITQEIELQLQLQQASKMDAVGRLAGGVAHDFNNLLQAILGFTEILLAGTRENDSQYNDLKQIERAAKRAADLTRQLLAFSRKQRIEPRVVDINQLVTAMEAMLRRLMGEDIDIVRQLAPDLRNVLADPSQIEQVIMNLAINARDAMPQGGRLTFKTGTVTLQANDTTQIPESHPGTFVCLTVSDTGTGIPQELIHRIFEPFFTTKGQGKGTGLGLAVIYGIVKQNAGWINVESQVGQGSTFKVYLPAHAHGPDTAQPRQPDEVPATLPGLGKSILLVEDEPGVLRLATLVLRSAGYCVTPCETAQEAHAAFDREGGRFNLLFSDVVLPGKNGIELATELRAKASGLPVLLCSGYADERVRWALIEQEGFHFLPKPYPTAALLQAVREALDLPQLPETPTRRGAPPHR